MSNSFVSGCCKGELCTVCKKPASKKVEEVIFEDDPEQMRHPYTAYLCLAHFNQIMNIINFK